MLDLIIKNGQCYIDGELKVVDVAIKKWKNSKDRTNFRRIKRDN